MQKKYRYIFGHYIATDNGIRISGSGPGSRTVKPSRIRTGIRQPWYWTGATRTFVQLGEGLPLGEVRLLTLILRGEGEEDLLQAAVAVAVAVAVADAVAVAVAVALIVCQVRVLEPCPPMENTKSMSLSQYIVR